jgi:ATP-dependent DNA helicase RecQ
MNLLSDVRKAPRPPRTPEEAVDALIERAEAQRRLDRSRVEMVRAYAETDRCRAELLLAYFGEHVERGCGRCDRCRAGTAQAASEQSARRRTPYDVGAEVVHRTFGHGAVVDVDGEQVTVLFDDVGYRTLDAGIVERKALLDTA